MDSSTQRSGRRQSAFKLAPETEAILARHARERGWTRTEVVARALRDFDAQNPLDGQPRDFLQQAQVAFETGTRLIARYVECTQS